MWLSLHYRGTNYSFSALRPKSLLCNEFLYKARGDNVRCPSCRTLLQRSFARLETMEPICFSAQHIAQYRQWNRSVSVLHTSPNTGNEPALTAARQTANTFRPSTLIRWLSRVMQNHRTVFCCLLILNIGECDVRLGHQCTFDRITSVHLFIHSSFYSPHCPCVFCCKMTRNFEHRFGWRVSVTGDVQSRM